MRVRLYCQLPQIGHNPGLCLAWDDPARAVEKVWDHLVPGASMGSIQLTVRSSFEEHEFHVV